MFDWLKKLFAQPPEIAAGQVWRLQGYGSDRYLQEATVKDVADGWGVV